MYGPALKAVNRSMPKLSPAAEAELLRLSPADMLEWYGLQHRPAAWWRRAAAWLAHQPQVIRRQLVLRAADTTLGYTALRWLCRHRDIHSVGCRGQGSCRGLSGPAPTYWVGRWPEWLRG